MAETNKVLITKAGLIEGVASASGETKATVIRVMDAIPQFTIDTLLKNLPKNENEIVSVPVVGFGVLGVKLVKEQNYTYVDRLTDKNNPVEKTKLIPTHYVPTFKIASVIKTELNPDIVKRGIETAKAKTEQSAQKKKTA
jgi:nucleoid DNA-binding protein